MTKVVIDTNVLVSAIFFDGLCEKILQEIIDGYAQGYINSEILLEYSDTVEKINEQQKTPFNSALYTDYLPRLIFIPIKSQEKICRDKDDNKFINCAIDAKATYLISGDKDLLSIKEYREIKIITPREYHNLVIKNADA